MDTAELQLHKDVTRAFILADAESIVLRRQEKNSDGAGGFILSPEFSLEPQTFRMIPQNDRKPEIADSNGRMAVPEFILLGEVGCDLRRYDRFTWKGDEWEIAEVHHKPDYEVKGDVIRRG